MSGSFTTALLDRIRKQRSSARPAGFLEVHSTALVQLMLHTLPVYLDMASQRAVIATIRQAVTNGIFLKTLAGALVKLDAAAVSRQVVYGSGDQESMSCASL